MLLLNYSVYIYIYNKNYSYKINHNNFKTGSYFLITQYIYIYSHPQTDCLVVSQFFSVAWHEWCLKLGSKPAQLYVRLSCFRLFNILPYRIPECLIHSKSFALHEWQPLIPSPECSIPEDFIFSDDCRLVILIKEEKETPIRQRIKVETARTTCISLSKWFWLYPCDNPRQDN